MSTDCSCQEAAGAGLHQLEDELYYMNHVFKFIWWTRRRTAEQVRVSMPQVYREYLEKECPRSKFTDDKSWIESLRARILNLMTWHKFYVIEQKKMPGSKARTAALVREITSKKIALHDRLEARIDKAIKRLAQLKTFKQIIGEGASQTRSH